MMMPPSIALIGPYPPPYGGVSVHIRRLYFYLKQNGYDVSVFCQPVKGYEFARDIKPVMRSLTWYYWLMQYGLGCSDQIIHCHYGWIWSLAMFLMLKRGNKIVMTFHDQQTEYKYQITSPLYRAMAKRLFRSHSVYWVAVSSVVREQLIASGVNPSRIEVIPAFLPAIPSENSELPSQFATFLHSHKPILTTYGYRLWLDERGQDVYGFDLCLDVVNKLKKEYPQIGLILLIPQISIPSYFDELVNRCKEYNILDNVLFFTHPVNNASAIWQASDVFIRASNTDGDSLSVREALSLGVPVAASDASPRPDGVYLFPNRNEDAMEFVINNILKNRKNDFPNVPALAENENLYKLIKLYSDLRGERDCSITEN